MRTARDVMHTPAPAVPPTMTARELHHFLLEHHLDGACVVDEGVLQGVVTTMDLLYREKRVHLPSVFFLLDAWIPLGGARDLDEELRKIAASRVADLATRELVTVHPDAPLDEVATKMVEKHVTVLPVMDGDQLVGMVTKEDVLRATLG